MCNLYSMASNMDAIRNLFKVTVDNTGNLPAHRGIYPNYTAPIVRNTSAGRVIGQSFLWTLAASRSVRLPAQNLRLSAHDLKGTIYACDREIRATVRPEINKNYDRANIMVYPHDIVTKPNRVRSTHALDGGQLDIADTQRITVGLGIVREPVLFNDPRLLEAVLPPELLGVRRAGLQKHDAILVCTKPENRFLQTDPFSLSILRRAKAESFPVRVR
jgi:hypothetical protein